MQPLISREGYRLQSTRLLQLKIEAMNPERRIDPEKENPRKYGGLGLVSIYVGLCQSLLFCVNLYFEKPSVLVVDIKVCLADQRGLGSVAYPVEF